MPVQAFEGMVDVGMADEATTISVVIPTHDRTDLLERALYSVLAQTISPVEIVVVDDLNDPEVAELVARIGDSSELPFHYVDASDLPRKAAGASRNAGVDVATGALIAFLDDDDYWDPTYLEEILDSHLATGADLVLTWASNAIDGRLSPGSTPTMKALKGFHPGMTGSNMFITRAAFDHVSGFDPGMWVMNDTDLFLRLREAGTTMAVVEKRLVVHEGRGVGHLSSRSERRAVGLENFLAKHKKDLTIAARRSVKRRIHRARTGPEHSKAERVVHTVALVFYTRPSGLYHTTKRRILRRSPMH